MSASRLRVPTERCHLRLPKMFFAVRIAGRLVLVILAFFASGIAGALSAAERLQPHPVSVADAIAMEDLASLPTKARPAIFSPNGRFSIVVIKKGNLTKNTNDYALVLFGAGRDGAAWWHRRIVSLSSSSNRPAIEAPKWVDNHRVAFLGEHAGQTHQLYLVDVLDGRLTSLSNSSTDVVGYDLAGNGREAYYLAAPPTTRMVDRQTARYGVVVSTQWLSDLIALQSPAWEKLTATLHHVDLKTEKSSLLINSFASASRSALWASPDGRHVVIARLYTGAIPKAWHGYRTPEMNLAANAENKSEAGPHYIGQLDLVDAVSGHLKHLAVPVERTSKVAWKSDGSAIFVAGVYLPLKANGAELRQEREKHTYVVEIRVADGAVTPITDEKCGALAWIGDAQSLICSAKSEDNQSLSDAETTIWKKIGNSWTKSSGSGAGSSNNRFPSIQVEEDLNTPPKLISMDLRTHRKSVLLDLNPQFRNLRFGRVENLAFRLSDGRVIQGGIYFPTEYQSGRRYPLVVQTHGWNPDRFWINGFDTTAFAAQPLAGSGFVVAQIQDIPWDSFLTPAEIPDAARGYEAVIDALDRKQIIDRNRVGIIGFSRTGLYVEHVLTHSGIWFAAASLADISDDGYFHYLAFLNSGGAEEAEAHFGSAPFGLGLKEWISNASGFNLDKVRTPVLLEANEPASLLFHWEWFVGLKRLQKPVEFIYIPQGTHELVRPWDRIVSQQSNVDWFRFWLQGFEDKAPSKRLQYSRWEKLCDLQIAEKSGYPNYCVPSRAAPVH